MDTSEARQLAQERLGELRQRTYAELLVLEPSTVERVADSGVVYQIETDSFWDNREKTNIRVVVLIDDGRWRAFAPLSVDFIMAPDGTFVGE